MAKGFKINTDFGQFDEDKFYKEARLVENSITANIGSFGFLDEPVTVLGTELVIYEGVLTAPEPPLFIRTLDAMHHATAIIAGETELVTTDKRLREAASLLGLTLFPLPSL